MIEAALMYEIENLLDKNTEDNIPLFKYKPYTDSLLLYVPVQPLAPEWGNEYGWWLEIRKPDNKYEVSIGRYTRAWKPEGWELSQTDNKTDLTVKVYYQDIFEILDFFVDFAKIVKALNEEITYETDNLVGLAVFMLEFDGSIQVNAMRVLMEKDSEELMKGPAIFTETTKYEVEYCKDLNSIQIMADDDTTMSIMLPDTATLNDTIKLIRDNITEHEKEIHKI